MQSRNPRGPSHPKRTQFVVEETGNNRELRERFAGELIKLRAAMGSYAPDEDEACVPMVVADRCFFQVGGALLTWDEHTKTAMRILEAGGSERIEAWRGGRLIGSPITSPAPGLN